MQLKLTYAGTMAIALCFACFTSCSSNSSSTTENKDSANESAVVADEKHELKPAQPKPAWGMGMTDAMAVVIEKLTSFNAPPIITLSAQEARKQPTPTDAVMAVIAEHQIEVPLSKVDTVGKDIPVKGGQIHMRIYTPKSGKEKYPVIVYYHGGGWVIADLNTYSASAEALAAMSDAVVVSVHYRQAPEYKFPTAHMDCYTAYEWVLQNAASIKGDPTKVAVAGESAGGNLAASVSMMARDKGAQMPLHQLLVYPIAGYDFNTESYKASDSTKPLNGAMMKWFFEKYLKSAADGKNPMISLVNAKLNGLPPTTIIAAEYDPLTSEGELLSENLKKAGVSVTYKKYNGVNHEFYGMAAVLPEAREAEELAASELKKALK